MSGGALVRLASACVLAAQEPAPTGPAGNARPSRSIDLLLERIGEATIDSPLAPREPTPPVRVELDAREPETVSEDGRTRRYALAVGVARDPAGRVRRLALLDAAGGAAAEGAELRYLAARQVYACESLEPFAEFGRTHDASGDRVVVVSEERAIQIPIVQSGPGMIGELAFRVMLAGDEETTPPLVEILANGAKLAALRPEAREKTLRFVLPPAVGATQVTLRILGAAKEPGKILAFNRLGLEAEDGLDRIEVECDPDRRGLAVEYEAALPDPVIRVDATEPVRGRGRAREDGEPSEDDPDDRASRDETVVVPATVAEDRRSLSFRAALMPGPVAIVSESPRPFTVEIDGAAVEPTHQGGPSIAFRNEGTGRHELTLRADAPLAGSFWLLQPEARASALRDVHGTLVTPVGKIRGLESPGGSPLVRHVAFGLETRRSLLLLPPSRVEIPVRVERGDRLELGVALDRLARHDLTPMPVAFEAVLIASDGSQWDLLADRLRARRRPQFDDWSIALPEEVAGDARIVFSVAPLGKNPWVAADDLLVVSEPTLVHAQGPRRPNVLVYLIDTLRADHCSPWGYGRDTTPTLSRIASEGIVFERAVSQAPWTRPSVATLFTGQLFSFHNAGKVTGLAPELTTLAEVLRAHGYATGAFISNAHVHAGSLDFEQGFSQFESLRVERDESSARAGKVHEAALAWLEANRDRPTFAYVHTLDPHAPYDPPPETAGTWARDYGGPITPHDTNSRVLNSRAPLPPADHRQVVDLYDEEILSNDRALAGFCDALRQHGLWDDTLLVILSDHGEEFAEHGRYGHGEQLFQPLLHVPLIVKPDRVPGRGAPDVRGLRVNSRVRILDLMPTILARVGIGTPGVALMGADLTPAFSGAELPDLVAIAEEAEDKAALFLEGLKLIRYGPGERSPGAWVYDLGNDPLESSDLAPGQPQLLNRLESELARILREYDDRGFVRVRSAVEQHLDAGARKELEELGYIDAGDGGRE